MFKDSGLTTVLTVKISQFMLHRDITAVCSQFHIKHTNTFCVQNVELLIVKTGCLLTFIILGWVFKFLAHGL